MAVDPNTVNSALQEFLTADKEVADNENQLANLQQNHTQLAQTRDQAKAKLVSTLG